MPFGIRLSGVYLHLLANPRLSLRWSPHPIEHIILSGANQSMVASTFTSQPILLAILVTMAIRAIIPLVSPRNCVPLLGNISFHGVLCHLCHQHLSPQAFSAALGKSVTEATLGLPLSLLIAMTDPPPTLALPLGMHSCSFMVPSA